MRAVHPLLLFLAPLFQKCAQFGYGITSYVSPLWASAFVVPLSDKAQAKTVVGKRR